MIETPCPQSAIAALIVGDEPFPQHDGGLSEAIQRIGAAIVGDGHSLTARSASMLNPD